MKPRLIRCFGNLSMVARWFCLAAVLTAQGAPQFTAIRPLSNHEIFLQFSAPTGLNYRLEVSSNLSQWNGFLTLLGPGSLQCTDSAAPFLASRYYHALQLNVSNAVTGDHLVTTNGDVVIHPVNHASFVMAWNGKMIYNDPVASSRFSGLPRADLVLLSHTHNDHFDQTAINAVTNTNAVIIAPSAVYQRLSTSLKSLTTVLANGMATNKWNLTIEAMPAYNLTSPSNHLKGVDNGYVLTIGGRRIYISADTEDTPEMRGLTNIDVAFLCMNRPYTMTTTQAVNAVRAFAPKVVYPYHYSTNAPYPGADLNWFKQQVLANPGVEVRLRKWY